MKLFGHQTTSDILAGQNVSHLPGGNDNFTTKEYSMFLLLTFFFNPTLQCHDFYSVE